MFRWFSKAVDEQIPRIRTEAEFQGLLDLDSVVLLKHSPTCAVSRAAYAQVRRFMSQKPTVPVRMVSVRADRQLSRYITERLKIQHQSPQVIVMSQGKVMFVASHKAVTADHLTSALY